MLIKLKQIDNSRKNLYVSFSSGGTIILFKNIIGYWKKMSGKQYKATIGSLLFCSNSKKELMTQVCSNSVLLTFIKT